MNNILKKICADKEELIEILSIADQWKKQTPPKFLKDKHVMLLFEKPSLRTRVSFEVGIKQLGGSINILNATEFKLGERETIYDTAKVFISTKELSRYDKAQ